MKPPSFSYHDPRTTADVIALLGSLENAKLLAGGQSLMPMLNMRYVLPDHLIDLNRVDGLRYIRDRGAHENGVIEIGAMTLQRDIEFLRRCAQALSADARGHRAGWPPANAKPRQTRHRAEGKRVGRLRYSAADAPVISDRL